MQGKIRKKEPRERRKRRRRKVKTERRHKMRVKSKKRQRIWILCLIISFVFPYVPGRVSEAVTKSYGEWEYEVIDGGIMLWK